MSNLKISRTPYDYNLHSSSLVKNCPFGDYVYHNVDVFYTIIVNEERIDVLLQNGGVYLGGDYSYPSNELQHYNDNDASYILNCMSEKLLDDEDEVTMARAALQEHLTCIKTNDDFIKLCHFFHANKPEFEDMIELMKLEDIEKLLEEDEDEDSPKGWDYV